MEKSITRLYKILGNCGTPASVVSKEGALLYINTSMEKLISKSLISKPFRCEWINKTGDNCPDCSERPVLNGRCFITKEESKNSLLYSAVRLSDMGNALVRIYAPPGPEGAREAENTIAKLCNLAPLPFFGKKAAREARPPENGAGELVEASLKNLLDTLRNQEGIKNISIINNIDPAIKATAVNPAIIVQTAKEIIKELNRIDSTATPVIDHMTEETGRGGPSIHIVSFTIETSSKLPGKALGSGLSAATIRLEHFTDQLQRLTDFATQAPKVLRKRNAITIHLTLPDTMRNKGGGPKFSQSIYTLLTPREEEIYELVRVGLNNENIARRLNISPATVKQNLKNIYRKAGVKSRTDLIFKY